MVQILAVMRQIEMSAESVISLALTAYTTGQTFVKQTGM
jgi:hypothetical protein